MEEFDAALLYLMVGTVMAVAFWFAVKFFRDVILQRNKEDPLEPPKLW